ncbi:MAG: hypothetical protein ACLQSR_00290 [Limisphaerales bacterium]
MKINSILTTALLALGVVSQAGATNPSAPTIYYTGSTAFRSTIYTSLADNTGDSGAVFAAGTLQFGTWGNSAPASANYMVFYGELKGTSTYVYINAAWSGSEAGIASACNTNLVNTRRDNSTVTLAGSPETWVDDTTCTLAAAPAGSVNAGSPGANGSPANGAQLEAAPHGSDLAQADTSQAVSWTPNAGSGPTDLKDYGSQGVVTFVISKNVNPAPTTDWSSVTNISLPQLVTLLNLGSVQSYFLSGDPNGAEYVYAVGRNLGSGTRMNVLSDSTYGGQKTVDQFSIGYGVDNRDPGQTPATLILQNEGDNGYESGGGVAKALADTGASDTAGSCQQADPIHGGTGWFAIGYLSPSDANSTGNNGGQPTPLHPGPANWITVSGYPSNNNNIENGQWWYWGHEHLYGRYNIAGTLADQVGGVLFTAVSDEIVNLGLGVTPAGNDAAIPYSLMFAKKGSDTAFPIPGAGE